MSSKKTIVKFRIKYSIKKKSVCSECKFGKWQVLSVYNFCESINENEIYTLVLIKIQHIHYDIIINKKY